jgi:hypothetical protein
MMIHTRAAMVRRYGVTMHTMRPPLPILKCFEVENEVDLMVNNEGGDNEMEVRDGRRATMIFKADRTAC